MLFELFSKRNKKITKNIFTYDKIPKEFRIQAIHIWSDAIGEYSESVQMQIPKVLWETIHKSLCKEYGVFRLNPNGYNHYEICCNFIMEEKSIEKVLDIVEISFRLIDKYIRNLDSSDRRKCKMTQSPDDAINELNERFREHSLGYQFIEGQIVRVDSEYIHDEAVTPAVKLLFDEDFQGASEEFFSAHEHFKKGRSKEAMTDACKAFESVMKTICQRKGWESKKHTSQALIDTLFKNNLIPQNLQAQFNSLRSTLESGLPTVRNNYSGHGQGETPVELPTHLVAYALQLAATNILFLIESYKASK
ncbi:STM4504/CBY_0614 family protein [Paenibacillus sp. 481]|uniref:STM4504/CBY_0614 family protein n=1 Tax=Paenibacillus sp. 481 TaxID=2835869 RepID=UPI001E3C5377|nr:hypothetical protein [Paenibacillus sp. 481]UHA72050.1 hypothetical protein KIK04_15190 [Paenibacillus sp. 481]